MNQPVIFDNNGESFDRYTIILPYGSILGASCNPFSPLGFGCTVGDTNHPENYVEIARRDGRLGDEVMYEELPNEVQEFINQYTKHETNT